jgi:hypothetical protein
MKQARLGWLWLACAVLLGVAGWSTPARGQIAVSMGWGEDFNPPLVTKRGVAGYARVLGLDDEQKQALQMLAEGTQAEYRRAMTEFRERMKALQAEAMEDQDWTRLMKELPELGETVGRKVEALEKQFFDDVKAICTESQLARWDALERYRRRELFLRFAAVSGAGADVVAILERAGVPEEAGELRDVLAQYELDIDKPLREMERFQRDQQGNAREQSEKWMKDPQGAMEEANRLMERMFEIGRQIRDINRECVRRVLPLLDGEQREKVSAEFNRRSFPRVYRESHASKMMKAALGFEDLTPEQRQELSAVREQYEREAAVINDRWARAIEDEEEKNKGTFGRMMAVFGGEAEADSPEKQARNERRELDKRTEERVRAILSESQARRLPEKKPETRPQWQEQMMPDMADWTEDGEER